MARKKKEPLKVFNGTLDVTEKDIARQNYYRLLGEQSARNIDNVIQAPQHRSLVSKILSAIGI